MRAARMLPILLFFSTCLVLGYLAATTIGQDGEAPRKAGPRASQQPAEVVFNSGPNGQQNFLLIGVDRLNSDSPRLESLWLALYLPDLPRITLVPLFPAPPTSGSNLDVTIRNAFHLESDGTPSPSFLQAIRSQDLWWSNYAVLDEIGLSELVDLTGGVTINEMRLNGIHAVASISAPWDNPQEAVKGQAALLQSFCSSDRFLQLSFKSEDVLDTLQHHLRTDLTAAQIMTLGKALEAGGKKRTCEFPTLSIAMTKVAAD